MISNSKFLFFYYEVLQHIVQLQRLLVFHLPVDYVGVCTFNVCYMPVMLRSTCNRARTDVRCFGLLGSIRILGADLLIKTISIAEYSYHLLGPCMQFISLGGT